MSSKRYAEIQSRIGTDEPYRHLELKLKDSTGSFRYFRDPPKWSWSRFRSSKSTLIDDILQALKRPTHEWQGPSWSCFFHAVAHRRPVSLITARGHHPTTIKRGILELVRTGHLPCEPNYLQIVPVSHPRVHRELVGNGEAEVSELKRRALRRAFETAILRYGRSSTHKFGFSDDDPKNLSLIGEELKRLKREYPKMDFFVISTVGGSMQKMEILGDESIVTRG